MKNLMKRIKFSHSFKNTYNSNSYLNKILHSKLTNISHQNIYSTNYKQMSTNVKKSDNFPGENESIESLLNGFKSSEKNSETQVFLRQKGKCILY